jgi:hypothetical protein
MMWVMVSYRNSFKNAKMHKNVLFGHFGETGVKDEINFKSNKAKSMNENSIVHPPFLKVNLHVY